MKKILFILGILFRFCLDGSGQQLLSSKEMVAITPAVTSELNLPEYARKALYQKLIQIVTQNGFGSTSGELCLTANVLVTDKQVTATVPAQFVVSLEVSLFLVNLQEKVILAETTLPLKGIDKAENRAMAQAINNLNPRSPSVRNFMNQCRGKVVDYYTTRIPALLAKARSLADRMDYEGALAVLSAVPESVDEYPAVADAMAGIYVQKVDKEAATALQTAKAQMAAKDYIAALNALLAVDASSTRFDDATKMITSIKQAMDEEAKAETEAELAKYEAEMEARRKAHEDEVMLEKMRIEAAREKAAEYNRANADAEMLDKLLAAWFLEKFK